MVSILIMGLPRSSHAQSNATLTNRTTHRREQQQLDQINYQAIGLYVSQPQENLTHFAVRLWPIMRRVTNKYGIEVCGYFAFDSNRQVYKIIVGTNYSQVRCLLYTDKIPAHTTNTLVSYHSHVNKNQLQLAKVDRQIMAITNPKLNWVDEMDTSGAGNRDRVVSNSDNQNFSALDYSSGQGYLATSQTLKYQNGVGTSQTLAIFQGFNQ